ncbi:Cell division and transport-associated protein TolQ [Sulfurivirga caldicuralii]|uniref:Cell division and transport-associated protein TolQ n=1 Tax=Sulfurivirga caldicuralii TaxID=364032 RepID=A0A1N6EQJ1_9GAMM|nr:MotA/TolQ/ExbB proton channel family protein [Sulfurivirga caldicuralii]SIN85211.1 Cell division and transport-associated protein TolQ [Sulfurivirga caldicuralii]
MEAKELLHLILTASPVVQGVIVLLLFMSVAAWAVGFAKRAQLGRLAKDTRELREDFEKSPGLQLYNVYTAKPYADSPVAGIFAAPVEELLKLDKMGIRKPEALVEGAERAQEAAMRAAQPALVQMLPTLAIVGSSAPYIGLFGTVWGVMHAFAGLANVKTATLSAVAPGIAEALIATAIGLFAAIPAVIAYNRLSARANRLESDWEALAELVMTRVHRQARKLELDGEGR